MQRFFFIIVFFVFNYTIANCQTNQQKKQIKDVVRKYKLETNDSLKKILLIDISKYYKSVQTKYFTINQINDINDQEIDQLIGNNYVSIDSIQSYVDNANLLNKIDFKGRPYTYFIIQTDINNCQDAGQNFLKEFYRRLLLEKLINESPFNGVYTTLRYYFRNPNNQKSFNTVWRIKDIKPVIKQITANSRYYLAYNNLYDQYLPNNLSTDENTITNLLIANSELIKKYIFAPKDCRKCQANTIPDIYKGVAYLEKLTTAEKDKLINPDTLSLINSGEIILTDDSKEEFKIQLSRNANLSINHLIDRYNYFNALCFELINKNYLKNQPIAVPLISLTSLQAAPNSDVITRGLSFEFLNSFIANSVSGQIGNLEVAKLIVEDCMGEIGLMNYTISLYGNGQNDQPVIQNPNERLTQIWTANKLKSLYQALDSTNNLNTNLQPLERMYSKGAIKKIAIIKRIFDLDNYKLVEYVKIKRRWWFNKRFVFTTDIPLKFRNLIKLDCKAFDVLQYSFLKRELDEKFGINKPFEEALDMLTNYPELTLPASTNSLYSKLTLPEIINSEISFQVGTGTFEKLNTVVGLKLGYQRKINNREIFSEVSNIIKNSQLSTADKKPYDDAFSNNTALNLTRNYLNYTSKANIDLQKKAIDQFYSITFSHNANLKVYSLFNQRANDLPIKSDCHWYQALWCNGDRNRKFNEARQSFINTSGQKIAENSSFLNSLPIFDILKLKNTRTILPYYTAYDTVTRALYCMVKVIDDNGIHILTAHTDTLNPKTNIDKADFFWKKYDLNYMQRYNVDISNLSDHGIEYLARLSDLFIKENMTNNTLASRFGYSGFIKSYNTMPNNFDNLQIDNEYINNFKLQSYFLLNERKLITQINNDNPFPQLATVNGTNQVILVTNNKLNSVIASTLQTINVNFDDALKRWNEWSIFIGFMNNGNSSVPIVIFSSGSVDVHIGLSLNPIFIIPLPSNF